MKKRRTTILQNLTYCKIIQRKRLSFIPGTKTIPFMDIILATETCATDIENGSKQTDSECLRQKVSYIFNTNIYPLEFVVLSEKKPLKYKTLKNNLIKRN